jgi:hypothetical protein
MPIDEGERKTLIKDSIDKNLYLFLEYMEGYPTPFNDFLKIVVSLQDQLDSESFTELFVRVCTYPKIEDLKVTPEIVRNAVTFLVEKKRDDKAAYGLLRLIYLNNITLTFLHHSALVNFQEGYEQVILRFFKSINPLESQIVDSLPPSAFCFTTPVLQSLRDKGCSFST